MQEKHLKPEDKFSPTERINGLIYIVDNASGKRVMLHDKVFKAKSTTKVAHTLYLLQEGYRIWLKQEGVSFE